MIPIISVRDRRAQSDREQAKQPVWVATITGDGSGHYADSQTTVPPGPGDARSLERIDRYGDHAVSVTVVRRTRSKAAARAKELWAIELTRMAKELRQTGRE